MVNYNYVDGVLSVAEVYMALMPTIAKLPESKNLSEMGVLGLQWASSGGEAAGVMCEKYLAADGIENVIDILERLENGSMSDVEFVELNACIGGCVGGVLNVENPFVAKARIRQLRKKFPAIGNTLAEVDKPLEFYLVERPLEADDQSFDPDRQIAFEKLMEIQRIYQTLPQLNCGACGAPGCRAFCEDIVMERIPADTTCPMDKGKKQ